MYGEIVSQRFEADVDNKRGPLLASALFNNFDVTLLYHMSEICAIHQCEVSIR